MLPGCVSSARGEGKAGLAAVRPEGGGSLAANLNSQMDDAPVQKQGTPGARVCSPVGMRRGPHTATGGGMGASTMGTRGAQTLPGPPAAAPTWSSMSLLLPCFLPQSCSTRIPSFSCLVHSSVQAHGKNHSGSEVFNRSQTHTTLHPQC